MLRLFAIGLSMIMACAACGAKPIAFDWNRYQPPDWRKYRAPSVRAGNDTPTPAAEQSDVSGRLTFHDLKTESDRSLSGRLLGAVGQRIAYIDRHKERWAYYSSDSDVVESIDLYTHPDSLGSQYGLCGVEKYTLSFDKTGRLSTVSMMLRYGVEGALFQKRDINWDYYNNVMCSSAPASHALFYFPALGSEIAEDAAMLLIPVIDLAASEAQIPYLVRCRDVERRACDSGIRKYIGSLRLEMIDGVSLANCPLPTGPANVCFTIETGEGKLGPYPKMITVKGSTYMNRVRIDSVDVDEGFTKS